MILLRAAGRDSGGDAGSGATRDSAEILFIKRAERAGDPWSGHLAFPGGRAEESDATLLDLAMRETAEEVGIDARQGGRVIGRPSTIRPLSIRIPSITVTPFVVVAPPGAVPRLQLAEVEEVFWMSAGGQVPSTRWLYVAPRPSCCRRPRRPATDLRVRPETPGRDAPGCGQCATGP
ncbi:MAG: NUDIX hydrolase [Spirochaetia bacterium]